MKRLIKQSLMAICLMLSVVVIGSFESNKKVKAASADFKVHYINVGGGDGALLELTDADGTKHYGMIDTGLASAPAGATTAAQYITKLGIKELDFVMMTHAHADHIGGMLDILKLVEDESYQLKINHIYAPYSVEEAENLSNYVTLGNDTTIDSDDTDAYDTTTVKNTYDKLKELNLDEETMSSDGETPIYQKVTQGDKLTLGSTENQVKIDIFGPTADLKSYVYGRAVNLSLRQINKTSIVCKMTYGKNTFLMTGDDQKEGDEKMIAAGYGDDLKVDVLKVPHHGLQDVTEEGKKVPGYRSDHKLLFDTAKAPLAIISNSNAAHSRTLEDLENAGSSVFQTRTKGDIVVTSNGSQISIQTGTNSTASSFDATYSSALGGSGLISKIAVSNSGKNKLIPKSYNDANTYNLYENKTVTLKFSGTVNPITSLTKIQYKLVNYGQNNTAVSYTTGTSVKISDGFKGRVYVRYVTPLGYTVVKYPGFTVDTKAPTSAKITGSKKGIKSLSTSSTTKSLKKFKKSIKLKFSANFGKSGASKIQYKIVPYGKKRSKYSYKTGASLTYKKKNKKVRVYVRFTDKSGNKTYRKTNVFYIK